MEEEMAKRISIPKEVRVCHLEVVVFTDMGVSSFPIDMKVSQYTQGTILHLSYDPSIIKMGIGLERRAS